jgi:hypothetical protein
MHRLFTPGAFFAPHDGQMTGSEAFEGAAMA